MNQKEEASMKEESTNPHNQSPIKIGFKTTN